MPCCGSVPNGPRRVPSASTTSALRDQLHRRLASPGSRAGRTTADASPGTRRCAGSCIATGACSSSASATASACAVGHHDAAAGEDHRELRAREQLRRLVEALLAAGAALDRDRPRDLALDVAVEEVARDVELRRAHLEQRAVERAAGQLGHARLVVHVRLVLGDLREDRQLLGLLEAAEAERHRCRFPA